MKCDLKCQQYRPCHVYELSDADVHLKALKRPKDLKAACGKLHAAYKTKRYGDNVLFTEEYAIYQSMHLRSIVF